MKFRIVKLEGLSGSEMSVYTVVVGDDEETLFERFLLKNKNTHKGELLNILARIRSMADKTGGREQLFKLDEGKPGDGVCALYDDPEKRLRLYCIRYGTGIIILGGGGEKPKKIRALQENKKLKYENYLLRDISKAITDRVRNKEIRFSWEDNEIIGNLEFDTDEED